MENHIKFILNILRVIMLSLAITLLFQCQGSNNEQRYNFINADNSEWIGPDFWANRLQDWQIEDGRIICKTSAPNRNLFLLTKRISSNSSFSSSVRCGALSKEEGSFGLRIGINGIFGDYRDDAVRGKGTDILISTNSELKIQSQTDTTIFPLTSIDIHNVELSISYKSGNLKITLASSRKKIRSFTVPVNANSIIGGIALISDFSTNERFNTIPSAWFNNWEVNGTAISTHPENSSGPILFAQHILSRGVLKMNVQMVPIEGNVSLEIFADDLWITEATSAIDPLSRTVAFNFSNWDASLDIPYRLITTYKDYSGNDVFQTFEGVIRKDPIDKDEITIAAFTGNNDLGFPNQDLVLSVEKQNPDFLFFSGDQIYEGVGGYGVQRYPTDQAILDYLRKWYLFGWTYRDLMRSIPSVSITDDHDVFHGNIWGESGKAAPQDLSGPSAQDQGGYKMPAKFVNVVQKTQTAHLPDPYDPTPVKQGIGVYYTSILYGGISFAILEDRKFKSAPKPLLPDAEVWNGWPQNKNFNIKNADHPDAKLLGNRQLEFLENWVHDWTGDAWMKVLLSQTIFANVATLPEEEVHDQNVPKLRILEQGEYAKNDKLVTDMDSNGWPQSGRDKALRILRKGFTLHLAGDQHLGSTIQYGIDNYRDGGYAICVPSVSNVWPRRWYPPTEGLNPLPGNPPYTGDYDDGFGNKMTVLAVSNPMYTGRTPSNLYDRATGYGIIKINRHSRDIRLENWPRDADPNDPESLPYHGWPITINQMDNYSPEAFGYLPEISIIGLDNPVIQVIHESTNEIIYSVRLNTNIYAPPVYKKGTYTVKIGNPEKRMELITNLEIGGNSIELIF